MGSFISIILSYHELKKHKEQKSAFFVKDETIKENMPFLSSKLKKEKDL